jgi:hypothetical protein
MRTAPNRRTIPARQHAQVWLHQKCTCEVVANLRKSDAGATVTLVDTSSLPKCKLACTLWGERAEHSLPEISALTPKI